MQKDIFWRDEKDSITLPAKNVVWENNILVSYLPEAIFCHFIQNSMYIIPLTKQTAPILDKKSSPLELYLPYYPALKSIGLCAKYLRF